MTITKKNLHHQVSSRNDASYPLVCRTICLWCLRSCTRSTPSQGGSSISHPSPDSQILNKRKRLNTAVLNLKGQILMFIDKSFLYIKEK